MLRARVLKFNHGRYRATQRLSEQSSAQSGPRKVLGGYGRVFLTCAWVNVGTNSTFIYTVLFDGIETWLGSLLAATFALPDPTLFDILDSPTPGTSLAAALTATAITALVLAPLDIYRITYTLCRVPSDLSKMILPVTSSRTQSVKRNPTPILIPNSLILPTVLHATIPNYLSSLFT